jgi:flagellar biosynthetic protein FliQ
MSGPEVIDFARDSIYTLLLISAPIMLVGLVVGVVIALVQALTQVQEMTLVFVPKIIAIFVAFLVTLPFIGATLGAFMERVAAQIMSLG